jgi:predicted HicB family RNase H-like nuclease
VFKYSIKLPASLATLLGITDVIGFHADNVQDLRNAFGAAVDDYLATCEKLNRPAQKPASGKLMLRVPPEVHGAALTKAAIHYVEQLKSAS